MTFQVSGRVLIDDAATVLAQGEQAIASGEHEIDLGGVANSDSSLIACILAWRRAAQGRGTVLLIVNPSERLRGLAALYGVEHIALG